MIRASRIHTIGHHGSMYHYWWGLASGYLLWVTKVVVVIIVDCMEYILNLGGASFLDLKCSFNSISLWLLFSVVIVIFVAQNLSDPFAPRALHSNLFSAPLNVSFWQRKLSYTILLNTYCVILFCQSLKMRDERHGLISPTNHLRLHVPWYMFRRILHCKNCHCLKLITTSSRIRDRSFKNVRVKGLSPNYILFTASCKSINWSKRSNSNERCIYHVLAYYY